MSRMVFVGATVIVLAAVSVNAGTADDIIGAIFESTAAVSGWFAAQTTDDNVILATETWTGGANDSAWSSNGNWSGIGGAGTDDDLVFPAAASRKVNVNDFPTNTRFHSITISGNDYSISGSQIFLTAGITANQTATSGNHPIFSPNIILDANQTFTTTARVLNLNGVINLNNHTLTFDGNGTTVINNQITGTGGLVKTGAGALTINGTIGAGSFITISNGDLVLIGSIGDAAPTGGALIGTGSFNDLQGNLANSAGTIAPGIGGTTTGTLTATGTVALRSTMTFEANLNGTTPGTQYDRLINTGGDISLNGSNLSVNLGFSPAVGQQFTIMSTSGAGNNIIGQFAQGTSTIIGGRLFTISYTSTSVVLTAGAAVTSLTWNGAGATNNWSDAQNWSPVSAPFNGVSLVFPAGTPADSRTQNNDISGLQLGSVTINSGDYIIDGNAVSILSGIAFSGCTALAQFDLNLTLNGAQTISAENCAFVVGAVNLNGFGLTFNSVDSAGSISITGAISGNGSVTKTGLGSLSLSSAVPNTYTGQTFINGGGIFGASSNPLGATGAGNETFIAPGAFLRLINDGTSSAESITVGGDGGGSGAIRVDSCPTACTLSGPITLSSNAVFGGNGNLVMSGTVSQTGGSRQLTKTGTGSLKLSGSNTYTGTTTINQGTLVADSSFAVNTDVIVGDGSGGTNSDILHVNGAIAMKNLTVNGSGLVNISGLTNLFSLAGSGNVAIVSNASVAIGGNPGNTIFSGVISGSQGTIIKTSTSTLQLNGANTFTGATSLTNGSLIVNGSWGRVTLDGSGTLGGSGTVSDIGLATGSGTISPGNSPGNLTSTGNVNLGASESFFVELAGTTPGSLYDRLTMSGSTNLGGASLTGALINGFVPAVGQQFTIVQSTGPINGQFSQGNQVTIGGRRFSITYNTNSVVLTALSGGAKPADFDGDNRTDVSIYRPSNGQWWLNRSTLGTIAHAFGTSTDKMTPGDYTGDGKTDVAIFRPASGEWFILRSEDSSFFSFPFGLSTDIPVPGDYDGDGKTDAAVFRPSTATWFIQNSSGGTVTQAFGANGDRPVPSDYDGDGKTDIAIFRPSNGQWWLNRSTLGVVAVTFGSATDRSVPGDYTGDGKSDVAIWRPATGEWLILRSENFTFFSFPFGTNGDIPSPGDYDGDGKFDATVFRPSSATWFIQQSGGGGTQIQGFGLSTDIPVPSAFVQ